MGRRKEARVITVTVAVRSSGLSQRQVRECLVRSLVQEPLTEDDLAELRRIRRLLELGINLPGIEVILRMRRRLLAMNASRRAAAWGWPGDDLMDLDARCQRLLPWEPEE